VQAGALEVPQASLSDAFDTLARVFWMIVSLGKPI
jgi:hypothetical protein